MYHLDLGVSLPSLHFMTKPLEHGELKLSHMGLFIRCCLLSSLWVKELHTLTLYLFSYKHISVSV